ncbi:MAG: hypothetical protein LBI04_04510 [Treponema sp.]|jgi:hypothetical protein|nr:hypothetical protein [Treponema sp.]
MKRITLFLLLQLFALQLFAQEVIGENQPQEKTGVTSSSEILLQAAFKPAPEGKLGFIEHFNFPFLQGEGGLTKDNNISLALTGEISPISINGIVEAVWTPIAFFQFAAGGRFGSGWNIDLFGNEIYGIGLNRPSADMSGEHDGKAFDGLLWKAQTGATLQADLAAVFPGDWNHVVLRSYHEINYSGYTRAAKGESWYYENDDGENCNGFNYYGNLLIGYQMPIFLNTVALMAEADLYLYDTPDRAKWGDDKIRWTFACALIFSITKQIDLTLITQFRTQKNYLEENWEDLYYRNRTIDSPNPLHLEFYRVAAAVSFKF